METKTETAILTSFSEMKYYEDWENADQTAILTSFSEIHDQCDGVRCEE